MRRDSIVVQSRMLYLSYVRDHVCRTRSMTEDGCIVNYAIQVVSSSCTYRAAMWKRIVVLVLTHDLFIT